MLKRMLFGLTALVGLVLAAPASAADLDKYVPADSKFYVHVNVPKMFASECVRKAVPMAFEKYGDQLIQLAGMAKAFNPQMPDVPEDQMKEGMKQVSDPKVIAKAFDAAGPVVSDIVIAGSATGGEPNVVFVIQCAAITKEAADQMATMMPAIPNMGKLEKIKKDKGNIYAMDVPNAPMRAFLCVPENGVLFVTVSEENAEKAFAASSKPAAKLAELMTKRTKDDFVFFAGLGEDDDDHSAMSGNLRLDKDINGKMMVVYKDEAKAKEQVKETNEKISEMVEKITETMGDKASTLKSHLEKSRATLDGKTVNATLAIPGEAVEKMLKKD